MKRTNDQMNDSTESQQQENKSIKSEIHANDEDRETILDIFKKYNYPVGQGATINNMLCELARNGNCFGSLDMYNKFDGTTIGDTYQEYRTEFLKRELDDQLSKLQWDGLNIYKEFDY